MQPAVKDTVLQSKMDECQAMLYSNDWLYQKSITRISERDIKIRAGVAIQDWLKVLVVT